MARAVSVKEESIDALLERAVKSVPERAYNLKEISGNKDVDRLLELPDERQCELVGMMAARMVELWREQDEAVSSNRLGLTWTHLPWSKGGGQRMALIMQRMLMKKLTLSEKQLDALARAIEANVLIWSVAGVGATMVRTIEEGQLSAKMLKRIVGTAKKFEEYRDGRKIGAKVLEALRSVGAVETEERAETGTKLTVWEKALLGRAEAEAEWPPSIETALAAGMRTPAETDQKGAVSFDAAGVSWPKAKETVAAVNGILAGAPLKYTNVEQEGIAKGPAAKKIIALGGPGIVVALGALLAMSRDPIRYEFRGERAQRFHNGFCGVLCTARASLTQAKTVRAEDLAEICDLLSRLKAPEYVYVKWSVWCEDVTRLAKGSMREGGDKVAMLKVLRFRERVARAEYAEERAAVRDLDTALGIGAGLPMDPGEQWSDKVLRDLTDMRAKERRAWVDLMTLAHTATGAKPSAKWLKGSGELVAAIGAEAFERREGEWFALVGRARPKFPGGRIEGRDSSVPSERGADVLRGLAWACAGVQRPRVARALGDLAMACYKMVPGVGARCIKPGTAAVWALSQMTGPDALAQLSRVRQLVKFGTAKKVLDTTLERLSAAMGVTPDELHEMASPDFGLGVDGTISEEAGEFTLELRVGAEGAEVRVLDEKGKVRASVPESVKKGHAETLKTLRLAAADIDKMLPAQKARIERLYHDRRTLAVDAWRQRYLEHPLVGTIARRLIWTLSEKGKSTGAIWRDGDLVDVRGKKVAAGDGVSVTLWHPAQSTAENVGAWRGFLESAEILQPFKQAHREVYLLTDAERRTGTYSNRFAGHIVRQSNLNGLCQQRNWKHTLFVLEYGDAPMLVLKRLELAARFEVQAIGDEHYGTAGAYSFLQTDRVHFGPIGENRAIDLERVDPLAFSEVMRDVDLFIAVCSIGNDPTWVDRGAEGDGFGNAYWRTYAFGDLTTFGANRREVLKRLLPRLKIAGVCELGEKFLKVRGKKRVYKIHLGSANILMEPNDQYLCIVPSVRDVRGGLAEDVYLPFEGDRTLAIILSKAFMLAEDEKITDSSITRQILA
jgi:hypothetical protein